jgi:hypothetical protein
MPGLPVRMVFFMCNGLPPLKWYFVTPLDGGFLSLQWFAPITNAI